MRYSIIHHDVREQFGLTISQYLVCDSIHQLSHGAPTKKTDTEISAFLGLDRSHVGHTRKELIRRGLVAETADGQQTTDLWAHAVVFAAKRGKSPLTTKSGENPSQKGENPQHSIYKEVKKSDAGASPPLEVREVAEDSRAPRVPRDNTAMRLREWCYKQIEDDTGVYPSPNMGDYKRIVAALKHLGESEIKEMMEDAIDQGKGQTVRGVFTDRAIDIYRQQNA